MDEEWGEWLEILSQNKHSAFVLSKYISKQILEGNEKFFDPVGKLLFSPTN